MPMRDMIVTDEREREQEREDAEVRMLEELWAASTEPVRPEPRSRATAEWLGERIGWIVAAGWLVFVVSLFGAPAGDVDAAVPLWAESLAAGFFLSLGVAGVLAAMRTGTSAYVASAVAGLAGLGLAVGCAATDHHAAGWWSYELGATFALTALSLGCVRRSRRVRSSSE